MNVKIVNLYQHFGLTAPENAACRLLCYQIDTSGEVSRRRRKPGVLILPGGAYCGHAAHEAEPVVRAFMPCGFNCFVLYYSVGEKAKFPRPLQDVSLAIAHLKKNAKKYNINPDDPECIKQAKRKGVEIYNRYKK